MSNLVNPLPAGPVAIRGRARTTAPRADRTRGAMPNHPDRNAANDSGPINPLLSNGHASGRNARPDRISPDSRHHSEPAAASMSTNLRPNPT